MVMAEYINPVSPITYKDYMDSILQLQGEKYTPFNRAGRGNTGYLFRVSTDLANFLFEIVEKRNGYKKESFINRKIDKQIITDIEEGLDETVVLNW